MPRTFTLSISNSLTSLYLYRLSDLTAHSDEQGSESHSDPGLPKQQPEAIHQQQAQQQEAHRQQAQHAQHTQQTQLEEVQRQQQAQHAQQQVQHAQQQQTQVEMSGAELMAEALGRLCQAATNSNKRSRAASPAGSSTSHTSHTIRHPHQAPTAAAAAVQSSATTAVASANSSPSRTASPAGSSRQHEAPANIDADSADAASNTGKPAQGWSGGQSSHAVPGGHSAQAPSSSQAIDTIGGNGHSPDGEASSGHRPGHGEASSGHAEVEVQAGGTAGMLAALQRLDAQPSAQHSSTRSGSDEAASEQASDAHSLSASTSQTDTGDLRHQERNQDGAAAGSEVTTAVANTAGSSWPVSTAAANDSDAENRSPQRPDGKAGTSQQDDSYTGAVASPQTASSSGSPVTPAAAAAFSFRSTMGRLRGLDAAELQSPNRRKYGRSESRDPGVMIRDHPVGEPHICKTVLAFPCILPVLVIVS